MSKQPLTVAWVSYFPVEWLDNVPEPVARLPRLHPATWQQVLLKEFEKCDRLKLHIIVLRKQFERNLTFERNGVTFHLVKTIGGLRAPSLFWLDTFLIRRTLRRINPDVVHAWGTDGGAALVASRLAYPYVVTMQGIMTWYRDQVPLRPYEKLAVFLEGPSLRRARIVTTESRFAVDYLQRKYPHLTILQAEHASNWVFHQVQRRPCTAPIRFITGSLDYRKGSDLLFRALDRLTPELDFELVVVGKRNPALFASWGVVPSPELERRIRFKTNLLPAQVAEELAAATIMILPTRADTSPNSVKEATVAGVPVVGSQVGGIPDYVFPGRNGLLFPSGDLNALVETIRAACAHPVFGRGEVEANTLRQVREYLSPAVMAQKFLAAYELAFTSQRK